MKLRKISFILLLTLFFAPLACEDGLDVVNPNEPTPDIVENEEGLKRLARGVYSKGDGWFEWVTWQIHEHMADNAVAPWINWNFNRFHGNVLEIHFSDGTRVSPVEMDAFSRTQPDWVNQINAREDPSDSGVQFEWQSMYRINNEANLILQTLENGVNFLGNAEEKERGYAAWAYFWKGYAYSRIGLAYELGLIVDEYNQTNSDYKTPEEMIEESNRMLQLAIDHAPNGIDAIIEDVNPAIFNTSITEESFIQACNTLIARNLLSVKKRDELTTQDWQEIQGYAQNGLTSNAGTFRISSDEATHLVAITATWRIANDWLRPSARVVQAASQDGDARADLFPISEFATFMNRISQPNVNSPHTALAPYGGTAPGLPLYLTSAEENMLILAEVELALGDASAAAGYIDAVRDMQETGLPALGTATVEDLRRERRIALFMRNTGFYDARRFGELDGCVDNLWVYRVGDDGLELDENATICYGFLEHLPVPAHETTFNPIDPTVRPTE
ncbi:hypothetical protein QLX67_06425 [Balneolaceae bacterium ANBcel3]|nr:hypothetical protein [Balneolaceae bacterium ANBcel3]